jgi:cyclic beta-1,2-glucan synthetase
MRVLRFRVCSATLVIDPCVPKAWRAFEITFHHHSTRYTIMVENPHGVSRSVALIELDGRPLSGSQSQLPLADDGAIHQVRIVLGVPMHSADENFVATSSAAAGQK